MIRSLGTWPYLTAILAFVYNLFLHILDKMSFHGRLMLVFWTGFWCGSALTAVLLLIYLRILSVRIHNLLIKDVCKAALICNHQHHWKLQFLIPIIWVTQVISRCFAVLRLEGRGRGTKPESGSKSSCGLAFEGKNPSNSTNQRLPRCIYLFFLPLNICSGSCVEFWVHCQLDSVSVWSNNCGDIGITKFATCSIVLRKFC